MESIKQNQWIPAFAGMTRNGQEQTVVKTRATVASADIQTVGGIYLALSVSSSMNDNSLFPVH